MTIDLLPEKILLEIFDLYSIDDDAEREAWQTLVHVCQKWRNVVFGSPHRLNLRLLCTGDKPVRKMLDIWPPLPIIIRSRTTGVGGDNVVAALTHNVRVCEISLHSKPGSLWEKIMAAMQEPFPALTHLDIHTNDEKGIVSNSFLGGSAPNLRYFELSGVPLPGLLKLLSSATLLRTLHLWNIPRFGYISPETMATALSVLTRLETVSLDFQTRSYLGRGYRHPPPPTRSVLPALTEFYFEGVSEYLEDLVAWIDAPLLDSFEVTFYPQLIFHTPRLAQFIGRTPNLMACNKAYVTFDPFRASVSIAPLYLGILCVQTGRQLSMLAQVCRSSLPHISSLEQLYIHEEGYCRQPDDIENDQWLELLRPFTSVKALYLSQVITPRIAPALQVLVGERVTEVLPALQSLFLEDLHLSAQGAIDKFVAARQLSGHHIAISECDGPQEIDH